MATTPNYGFIMPDPTDLVTDLPADFEIFGDEVDLRVKALNPETTEGDLAYRGATADAKDRLAIGTAGQVLAVNSGADAPEWVTPTGGVESFTLVNAGGTTLTGANTITISGITDAKSIHISVIGAQTATANSDLQFRLNTNSSSVYNKSTRLRWNPGNTLTTVVLQALGNTTNSIIQIAKSENSANKNMEAYVRIDGCSGSGAKPFYHMGGGLNTGNNFNMNIWGGGVFEDSAPITSISIISDFNFTSGTVFVYAST